MPPFGLALVHELVKLHGGAITVESTLGKIPVIPVSTRAGEEARIDGLQQGAEDYLIKPFSARELLARVRASLRVAEVQREANAALQTQMDELERFNRLAVGRELRIIEMKTEVNDLGLRLGQPRRYPLAFDNEHNEATV
jgi:DNA-binding response OmpR family regulator